MDGRKYDGPAPLAAQTPAMPRLPTALLAPLLVGAALATPAVAAERVAAPAERRHADLLTGGLGLDGLRGPIPALADPAAPTFDELRRRALWTNWRGIADVAPGGGLGTVYGDLAPVPGREYHGDATLPGARRPHRMMLLLPDAFDRARPCLVVGASSGSRGIYGAIALLGGWGLPRGCAVATTDKGAGTDWQRVDADGTVAIPHAHSGDHPEADWGRHVLQTAAFAARMIEREHGLPPQRLQVLLLGVSNGGTAVLQAAGLAGDPMLDLGRDASGDAWVAPPVAGVVAVSPNVHVDGARPLYDVATEAALVDLASAEGRATLAAAGWTDAALDAAALSAPLDLWRAVAAGYASAYLRRKPHDMPAGYRYAACGPDGGASPPMPAEAALWWSDSSGLPPGSGVVLLDPPVEDGRRRGLEALRALWTGDDADARTLRQAVAATRPRAPRPGLPVIVVHGRDDGLVPEAFSTAPYVAWARSQGSTAAHWSVAHVQHFDAFLGLPTFAARYLPLLPYAWAAADTMQARIDDGAPPADRRIDGSPRAVGTDGTAALQHTDLGL